jgi:hypothetical protein
MSVTILILRAFISWRAHLNMLIEADASPSSRSMNDTAFQKVGDRRMSREVSETEPEARSTVCPDVRDPNIISTRTIREVIGNSSQVAKAT